MGSIIFMCLKAFLVGGIICVIGQLLIDITKLTPAKILVLFVCLGVLLGAVGIYDKLVDFSGAGATIPIVGFGNALANGVRDSVKEQGFMGVVTGPLTACAGGVTVAILSGLIVAFTTKPKDK
ncbi:MAG: stage V sporulation protein AE [Ruminococcaceae bacterium]|nr:stage V sporulation protein AE [Oscillospiraceae bacterium]